MKPYYEHAGITIYHGDCREVLQAWDGPADLLLSDPPYGARYVNDRFGAIAGDESTDVALAGIAAALKRTRVGRHVYLFGRYDLSTLHLTETAELIWDKGIMGQGGHGAWVPQHEYIQFATYRPSAANRRERGKGIARMRRGTVLRYQRAHSTGVDRHPTEKPVPLLRELIECSSKFSECVLDPFAGIGSTLIAAALEGRQATGIEIEERYCEIAAKRLSQEVLPLEATA